MFSYSGIDIIVLPLLFILMLLFSVFLKNKLQDKDEFHKELPLLIITICILVLEASKQIRLIIKGYDWWGFPMHFCSLFLYVFPMATLGKGKIKEIGKTMSIVCTLFLIICFYVSPASIIGREAVKKIFTSFDYFHTVVYHHLAILYGFIVMALDMVKINKESYLHVIGSISVYGLVAVPLAYITDTNYCNLITTDIPLLKDIIPLAGQGVYVMTIYLIGIFGGCLLCKIYSICKSGKV